MKGPSLGPKRIRTRLLVTYLLLTAGIFGTISYFYYYVARDALDREMGRRLVLVAQIAARSLDGGEIAALHPGDEKSVAHETQVRVLQSLLNVGAASRIYIFDAERRSIVDTEPGTPIGTEYFRLAPHAREIRLAFDGVPGDATVFRGLDDQWYKSAFAPVKEGDRVVAVVGVEAGVTFFDTLRVIRRNLVLFGVIAAVLMMAASLLLAVGFERPIARLVQSAQRLAEGDLVTRIESTSHDEIGFLAEALDDARSRIVERDRNLKMLQRGIAHEVRNPLGGMRLFCDILSEELADEPEKAAHVEKIRREVLVLERVVNEFLEFTRDLPLDLQRVEVGTFIQDILAGYMDLAAKDVQIVVNIAPEARTAQIDPDLVRRALYNLINNGIQAMPKGGRLQIDVFRDTENVHFIVTDTGMGIAPDAMEHMFTPFYTTKDKGTGLGLPFARKIAERHGGTLELLSQLNAGTTVRLSIPGEPEAKGSLTDE